jgi:CheY-like chemotaxis protein
MEPRLFAWMPCDIVMYRQSRPPEMEMTPMSSFQHELFYVDDSSDDIFLLQYARKSARPEINITAYTIGQEALDMLERRLSCLQPLPSMVVADFYMPVMDGPDLVRQIRAQPELNGVMIAICSGSNDPRDRAVARSAGADIFLEKPLDLNHCAWLMSGQFTTD